jgi:pimeloyl-ACP methyl ester carboxylesterase
VRASAADGALMITGAMTLSKRYADLKVPVTIMSGTQDRIVDFGHNSERLHERIQDSELELVPGAGHMVHYADPDKVMAAIDAMAARAGEPVMLRNPQADARARASESGV